MLALRLLTPLAFCAAATAQDAPRELGAIAWQRDFEAGVKAAAKADKPVLLLFQEVPG